MEDCRSRYRTHILLLQTESKLCKDFWDTINNPKKVNLNLLTDDDIETYTIGERKDVIMVISVSYTHLEWEEQREKFLQGKTSYWIRYEFLVEEELFERLLQEIQKNQSVHVLDQYEKVLKKYLPNEIRDMYVPVSYTHLRTKQHLTQII